MGSEMAPIGALEVFWNRHRLKTDLEDVFFVKISTFLTIEKISLTLGLGILLMRPKICRIDVKSCSNRLTPKGLPAVNLFPRL